MTDLLSSLLNKSLVQAETQKNGERRFKLLETLREYALEQLIEWNELQDTRHQHAAYFCALAETAELELYGPHEIHWLDRLTLNYDNLRAALTWSLTDCHDVKIGLRLVGALWWFWYVRSYHSEGMAWLHQALACATTQTPALRAKILQGAALLTWANRAPGQRYIVSGLIDESIALYRQVDDKRNIARSLTYLSLSAKTYAEYAPAAEEAKHLFKQLNDAWGLAWIPLWEYYVMQPDGRHLPVKESVALLRAIGGKSSLAFALLVQARQTYAQGDFMLARLSIEESIVLYRQVGHKWLTAHCLCFLGDLLRCRHELGSVLAIYEEALLLTQQSGDSDWVALIHYSQGLLAHLQGNQHQAAQQFKEALLYYQQQVPNARASISANLRGLALVMGAKGEFVQVVCLLAVANTPDTLFDLPDWPHEIDLFPNCLAAARTHLDNATFALAWQQGCAMTMSEAITYALQAMDRVSSKASLHQ